MRHPIVPWIVLATALLFTAVTTWSLAAGARERDRARFQNAVLSAQDRIEARLDGYLALLRGGSGLLAAEPRVSRSDFAAYVARLDLEGRYPGVQGIGFSMRVPPGERDSLVAAARASGIPEFRIWPDTPRAEHHTILYLEPMDRRNRAALGYDMFSDPTRRAAMELARDSGAAAMSGAVTLVQEIDEEKQAGFLIYVPVYRTLHTPASVAARREAIEGFVYSPFRANDLFAGIFGSEQDHRVHFRVYDGPSPTPAGLLHDSRADRAAAAGAPALADTTRMRMAGRTWTLVFTPSSAFTAGSSRFEVGVVAAVGLLVSLALFALSWGQAKARALAERHAAESQELASRLQDQAVELEHQTEEAQALAERLEASHEELIRASATAETARADAERERTRVADVLESITDASFAVDRDWRVTFVNAAFGRITGRGEELLGRSWWDEFPELVGTAFQEAAIHAMRDRAPVSMEEYFAARAAWYDIRAYPTRDGGLAVYFRDVTARRRAEERARFLTELNHVLQALTDPDEVTATAARRLCDHLGTDRCVFAEVEEDEDHFTVTGAHSREGIPAIAGRFATSDFGREALGLMREDRPYVVHDVDEDARLTDDERAFCRAAGIRALIRAPLHRAGRFVASLAAHQSTPRRWSRDEIELVTTVAARCWESIERARAEKRQRASAERYRLVTRATQDVIWDWDLRSDEILWNEAVHVVLGYPATPLAHHADRWSEQIHPEDRQRVVEGIRRVIDGRGDTWEDEYRYRRFDGTYAEVHDRGYVSRDADGTPLRMIGAMQDVTGRRRAERIQRFLAEASQALATALEYSTTPERVARLAVPFLADLCIVDLLEGGSLERAAVVHADRTRQGAVHALLRDPPPAAGRSGVAEVLRSCTPRLEPEFDDAAALTLARDAEHRAALRAIGPRSVMIVPLVSHAQAIGALTLVLTSPGRRYGADDLAVAEELARRAAQALERTRLYEAERHARAVAEEANRSKSQFLANMSHELRTPLNAIGGYAELLEMGIRGPVTDAQRSDLERIKRAQTHLLGLINDVLNFAKLEAGRVEFGITHVRLEEVLSETVALIAPQAAAKGISYRHDAADSTLTVRADPEKVRQILLNLLSNAIKFTEPAGEVRVDCEPHGAVVRIHVRDTGIGVAADKLEAIFEPFVQVNADLTRTAQGTGLGLAISRELARGMGGDLTAESTPGVGSTFTLTLPR